MFKRGKDYQTSDQIRATGDAVRYSGGGTVVVFHHNGTPVAVKLETDYPYGTSAETRYGPADQIGNALADILRHITGTPQTEVSHDDDPEPEKDRFSDLRADPGIRAARLEGQRDALEYLKERLEDYQEGRVDGVVSFAGLNALVDGTIRLVGDGQYVQRSPF